MLPALIAVLAEKGLGLIGNAIVAKGKEVVEEKLGVKIPDDPKDLTPELTVRLQERQAEHEEFLVQAEITKLEIEAKDRDSARKRETEIATSDKAPLINKVIAPCLAAFVIGASFLTFWILFFSVSPIDPSRKDILIYILGVLSAMDVQIMNYYFGTSEGSTRASQLFRDMVLRQK